MLVVAPGLAREAWNGTKFERDAGIAVMRGWTDRSRGWGPSQLFASGICDKFSVFPFRAVLEIFVLVSFVY